MTKKSSQSSAQKKSKIDKKDFLVVGLGASAGGVKALQEFFATMPPNSGMAFVAILHLSPEHESSLAQILQAQTEMNVTQVTETVKVEPNNVYVIPPDAQLEMVDGVIRPNKAERPVGHRIAIDVFFRTLAEAYERNAVCVVMSGTGSDGTLGLKRVKESNGFAIVQDPEDAEYDSMPRSAINTQLADWILPVHQMPEKLIAFRESSEKLHLTNGADPKKIAEEIHADESLREILTLLRVRTGHDFSNYKTPTLVRRIARHLQIHELTEIPSYLELLRNQPNEIQSLLKNLLINVTNFFRDKTAFEALEGEIIPNLFAGKTGKDTVRVWSCGCASGEEAFSLAMLLTEYADRLADPPKIQVFASDVDEDAIAEARDHRYPESVEADILPERLKRFFVKEGAFYRVKKELRETVLFAPHNVLRDPPFSRLDLITCRNLLIYLNRETQERVLQIFHFALTAHGYLFLGSSETAENTPTLYAPVNKKQRIYSRRAAPVAQTSLPMMPVAGRWEIRLPERKTETIPDRAASLSEIHYKLLENYAPSSVLVNQDFDIVYLSGTAGKFLRFSGGEPSRNLLKAVNPDLLPDLRAALFTAQREHKSSEFPNIRIVIEGEERIINLIVRAVDVQDEASDFLLVIFEERNSPSVIRKADREIKKITNKDEAMETVVRRLEEDLQRTKEHLRYTIEQHETSVEELKASNEELQAINEELRSASEELETSKEELQSVNEELTTVNHELKDKIDETSRINSDLSNLMAATDIATIFLDKNLRIKRYTPPVEEFFNITKIDVGRPLEHFTHKLNYDDLAKDAAQVLKKLAPLEHEITDKNGRQYLACFVPYRTLDDRIEGVVLNFIDITERKKAERTFRESEEKFSAFISTTSEVVYEMSADWGEMHFLNSKEFIRSTEIPRENWIDSYIPDADQPRVWAAVNQAIETKSVFELEHQIFRLDGSIGWMFSRAIPLVDEQGKIVKWFGAASDITERKRAEEARHESESKYRALFTSMDEAYAVVEVLQDENGAWNDFLFLEVNPAFVKQTGMEYPVGRTATELLGTPNPHWAQMYGQVVETGEPVRFEEGEATLGRVFDLYCFRLYDDDSRRVAVLFTDITARKRSEVALRESEERLHDILDSMAEGFALLGSDFTILDVNEETLRLDGRTRDELIGRTHWDAFPNTEDSPIGEIFKRVAREGTPGSLEHEYSWTDDRSLWLDMRAYPTRDGGVAVFWRDFSDRKRAEEALRESKFRLQSIANLVPDLLWDSEPNGSTNWYNQRWLEYTGQSFEEAIGWGWVDAIHPDDREASARRYREAIENGEMLRQEHRIRRYDGEYRWFVANAFPLKDESGEIIKMYGAATDIHESRLMHEAMGESEELFRLVSDAVPSVIYDWNVPEDKITRSGELKNLLGFSPDDTNTQTNKWWKTRLHPDDAKRAVKEVAEKLKSNDYLFEDEYRLKHRDGRYVWVSDTGVLLRDEAGKVVRWVGSVTDISERKEIAEALRESEEKYRMLFESIDLGFCVVEVIFNKRGKAVDYRFIEANPAFFKQTGLKDAVGKTMREFAPNHEKFWFDTFGEIATTGKPARVEHVAQALGRWYEAYAFRIGASGENQVAILFRDIAERRHADELIRESEERLRIAVEAAALGTWEWDLTNDTVIWNERHFQLLGMPPRENPISAELFFEHVHVDDRERVRKQLEKSVKTGRAFESEFCIVRADGQTRWVEGYGHVIEKVKGKPVRMAGVMSDITERKRIEEIIRKSEQRLQLILHSITDYAVITTDPDGVINGWNTGAENTFGWTAKQAVGKPCAMIFTPEDREAGIPEKEMKVAIEKGIAEDRRWHVRKDGTRFFASGTVSPIRNGEFEGFVKITSDQTARMEAEKALHEKELLQQFVKTQEDERRRIARDIHDQLGQQLTVLRLKIAGLKKTCAAMDIPNKEKAAAQIDELQKTGEQIDRDVDFLAWELRPASLEDLGLRLTLQNFVKEWSLYTGIKAGFQTTGVGKVQLTSDIETNLYRIAQEALNNILKHAEATAVSVILEKRKETLVLIVEDDGAGFEVTKNKKSRGGKGLGLLGMQERSKIIGGEFELESELGKGTTIYVRVPVKPIK